MAAIVFDSVTKVFSDGTVAVSDLTLSVPDGEFIVLVGPSGSGKSTALRMLAGLEELTSGTIRIGEQVVNDEPPRSRDVAMVFQNYALYPHKNVYDNIAFGLKMRRVGKKEIRRRVTETSELLGIAELVHKRPRELSGGQRQRVAMGRAIVREPKAFLMDEPLSNLDAKLRVEMRAYIARLHQAVRTTTVYVTHDQTEAMTMGDRVAVMRDGRLEQVDSPQALYERPSNLFVAGFIGSPAMNFVSSQLMAENGSVYATLGKSRLRLPDPVADRTARLGELNGRPIILGIRPEDLEDASLAPGTSSDRLLDVSVALAEPMGAEVIAHFDVTVPAVRATELDELADALHGADGSPDHEHATTSMVARLNPRTAARAGERLRLAVDTERVHLFDPETERPIL